jgi:hypothetical protein
MSYSPIRRVMNINRRIPHLHYYIEERDGIAYHMCGIPGHTHWIPLRFSTCDEKDCWTWDSKYRYKPDPEE